MAIKKIIAFLAIHSALILNGCTSSPPPNEPSEQQEPPQCSIPTTVCAAPPVKAIHDQPAIRIAEKHTFSTPPRKLVLRQSDALIEKKPTVTVPGQHPNSRLAIGHHDISKAWFAGPTSRYKHGVFGHTLEASQLIVETSTGQQITVTLPEDRVFEDIEPRLVDITGDQTDEVLVIESQVGEAASLAIYDLVGDRLVKHAATPFLENEFNWLNPLGLGDFDGDGIMDLALVATPHIGGILKLYHLEGSELTLFAKHSGVSTHRWRSTELGLGRVVSASPRDQLLLPDQKRRSLILLEWTPHGWREHDRIKLPAMLKSSLVPIGPNQWRFQLKTGLIYEVHVTQPKD